MQNEIEAKKSAEREDQMKSLPAPVQEAIDAYGKYYAKHHKLGMSVRDDMTYIAQMAMRWVKPNDATEIESAADDLRWYSKHLGDFNGKPNKPWVEHFNDDINALRDMALMEKARADRLAALTAQPAQEPDAAHLQTIDERDAAEEAVSDIYYRITGRSPEWSNLFGFEQAIDEIQDAFDLVRAVAKSNTAPPSGVREGMIGKDEVIRMCEEVRARYKPEHRFAINDIIDNVRAAEQINAEGGNNGKV